MKTVIRPRGRPRAAHPVAEDRQIPIRLAEPEYRALAALAAAEDRPVTVEGRRLLTAAIRMATQVPSPPSR